MKVKIKDLRPNPYRDMKNYPINREKVEALKTSIKSLDFWDNILARKSNGKTEIAYGHHRLIALGEIYNSDHEIDIPVKKLDDTVMIKIMANENMDEWKTAPAVIDETVRVTKEFLEAHPEEAKKYGQVQMFGSTEPNIIGKLIISRFLDGNWNETRVQHSLERLTLIEKEIIEKEAIDKLPTERAARDFVKAVKQVKDVTPEQQKKAAERIVKDRNFGESAVKKAILEEKFSDEENEKAKREIEFEDFLNDCRRAIDTAHSQIEELLEYKDIFDSDYYRRNFQRNDFIASAEKLISSLNQLLKGEQHGKLKA